MCTAVLVGWDPQNPPHPTPPHLGSYMRALLVSQHRRHLLEAPYTVKTPDVDFRTYNRMPQDQTVHGAENVSSLWPSKYICISVVFRHLRNFPEVFRKFSVFPVFFGNFRRFSPIEKLKSKGRGDHGGNRTHNLRITDLILYLPATDALCKHDK